MKAIREVLAKGGRWLWLRPYTIAATVLLTALAWPFLQETESQWDQVYVAAAHRLLTTGDVFTEGYYYPPFMALGTVPFAGMPPIASRLLWYLLNVVCIVLLWRWAWRLAGGKRLQGFPIVWREQLVFALGLACAFRFGLDGMQNQQTDIVIGALLIGGCLLLSDSRSLAAAACFAVAAAMKCTALLWCPYFLWRRQWAAALCLPCMALGLNLLPDAVRTPHEGGSWLGRWVERHLQPISKADAQPGVWPSAIVYNQSLAGAVNRAFVVDREWVETMFKATARPETISPQHLKLILYGSEFALLVFCGGILLWSRRAHGSRALQPALRQGLEYSVVLLLMPLLSPMSSKPHFCTLLLPAFLVARLTLSQRSWVLGALLTGAILSGVLATKDLAGNYLASLMMWYGGVTISTCLLLAGCLYVLALFVGGMKDEGGRMNQTDARYILHPSSFILPHARPVA